MVENSSIDGLFYFMQERHKIWIRRAENAPWPWTKDTILQEYKFTNVFRELDGGTVHCRKAIRIPFALHSELFYNIATYRIYNYIETQKAIGFIEDWPSQKSLIMDILRDRYDGGEQVFTGAHMITGTLGGSKLHQVFDICFDALWENRRKLEPKEGDNLQDAFKRLSKKTPGIGPFIAYEIVTDLRWTRYLQEARDVFTWANPGPGAMRGINRLCGLSTRPAKQETTEFYIRYMQWIFGKAVRVMPNWMPKLEMRDIEHSLCEWDKYERARLGQGRPRNKFIPPHLRE